MVESRGASWLAVPPQQRLGRSALHLALAEPGPGDAPETPACPMDYRSCLRQPIFINGLRNQAATEPLSARNQFLR